jgi:hypothetical protein
MSRSDAELKIMSALGAQQMVAPYSRGMPDKAGGHVGEPYDVV